MPENSKISTENMWHRLVPKQDYVQKTWHILIPKEKQCTIVPKNDSTAEKRRSLPSQEWHRLVPTKDSTPELDEWHSLVPVEDFNLANRNDGSIDHRQSSTSLTSYDCRLTEIHQTFMDVEKGRMLRIEHEDELFQLERQLKRLAGESECLKTEYSRLKDECKLSFQIKSLYRTLLVNEGYCDELEGDSIGIETQELKENGNAEGQEEVGEYDENVNKEDERKEGEKDLKENVKEEEKKDVKEYVKEKEKNVMKENVKEKGENVVKENVKEKEKNVVKENVKEKEKNVVKEDVTENVREEEEKEEGKISNQHNNIGVENVTISYDDVTRIENYLRKNNTKLEELYAEKAQQKTRNTANEDYIFRLKKKVILLRLKNERLTAENRRLRKERNHLFHLKSYYKSMLLNPND